MKNMLMVENNMPHNITISLYKNNNVGLAVVL